MTAPMSDKPALCEFCGLHPAVTCAQGFSVCRLCAETVESTAPNELHRHPDVHAEFTHTRSCPALTPYHEEDCTCGLKWRIQLATEQEMHSAWRKRAEQAEHGSTEITRLRNRVALLENKLTEVCSKHVTEFTRMILTEAFPTPKTIEEVSRE